MISEPAKAVRYVQQLDTARSQGNWEAVPELLRKIKKHAPERTCLILTAEAEYAVIHASHTPAVRPSTARPSTAKPPTPISEHIPALLDAIQSERTYVEDEFQARVCLGWIHWQLEGWEAAVARLPKNVEQEFAQLEGTKKESAEWTKVCALKATYIKGNSEERIGKVAEALETYESSLPIYATVSATIYQGKELKIWTELYLTGFCTLASRLIKPRITSILETETLSAFRAWSSFWDHQSAISGGQVFHAEVPRRQVWRDYYFILSDILQQEVPYPTTSLVTSYASHSTRSQQRAELKEVEAKYESLLLNEVTFPKSEDPSEEIEAFVETAMQNWRILSGSGWAVEDLGEGGTDILSRGVLDLLYRAATKTFHSTAILRYLFTVHRAVAEFDLAFKAFDTYMDIVKRARARVEKTGVPEHGLDNDQTVLVTASECIKSLCRYGSRDSAEKAKELGHFFETWLDKHYPVEISANVVSETSDGDTEADESVHIDPHIFALAWRCIGIGYANWARFTFEGSARTNIQLQAIACFKKALRPEYESSGDVETLFALGTILAERREIAIALQVVKSGLQPASASSKKVDNSARSASGRFARERSLIPLWHLMALLLSAKQDFATAARSCEGAFEQFQDPKNLFGDENLKTPYQSDHLQLSEKSSTKHVGVVDSMDDFEKEGVLEVKMTQLALVEVMEGPEVAVNASDELLALYTRLFGDPSKESVSPYPNKSLMPIPPKSSAGTLRSIKGSIFGRSGRSIRKARPALITEDGPITVARPQTSQTVASTQAPMIQVTNENGNMAQKPHHLKKPDRRSGSLSRLDGATSTRARSTSTGRRHASSSATLQNNPASVDGETYFTPLSEKSDNRSGVLADIPQSPASFPPALISPPSITPITHFPKNQERRRRTTILVKVWLLISGFYRRASMYEDARGAIEEADKLVSILDDDISRDITGDVSMNNPGWGGRKCVGELLGDVCSELGYLAVAERNPYAALAHFESALTYHRDHPSAIVGLSNILLDIYTEELLPPPSLTPLVLPGTGTHTTPSVSAIITPSASALFSNRHATHLHPYGPLGMSIPSTPITSVPKSESLPPSSPTDQDKTKLQDRIAARDRASFLLGSLTRLGRGWNYSEAWFALARAYELQGQIEKAKEVLWWCVELEDSRGVRDWEDVGGGGYVL